MRVFVSLWSADLLRLAEAIDEVADVADGLHIDIFDGVGTPEPELLFGPDLVAAVRAHTSLPVEVHLCLDDAALWIPRFASVGADIITFQAQRGRESWREIDMTRSLGVRPSLGLAVGDPVSLAAPYAEALDRFLVMGTKIGIKGVGQEPATPFRVQELRALTGSAQIFVDGGIRESTVPSLSELGATGVIAGSLVMADEHPSAAIRRLHELAEAP